MIEETYLLSKEVVLIDWDWPNDKGPKCVEAIITNRKGESYIISLLQPIILPDGSSHDKLVITRRHVGHPISNIYPSFIRKVFIFKHPLSRLIVPLVAVNISTIDGKFISIACIYLKSIYLKAGGKL